MIKNIWSVLCERIVVDKETNLISYLICVEQVTTRQIPAKPPLLAVGCQWKTDRPNTDILKFRIMLLSPNGSDKKLVESDEIKLKQRNFRTNIYLNGLSFNEAGEYCFKVQQRANDKWMTVAELPLMVVMDQQQASAG